MADPNQEFDASNTCQCKTGYTATGVAALSGIKCIADARMTALNVYSETRVTFLDVLTSTGVTTTATVDPSLTFKDLYIPAAAECFNWLDGALCVVRFGEANVARTNSWYPMRRGVQRGVPNTGEHVRASHV